MGFDLIIARVGLKEYTVTAPALDITIERYLPNSIGNLRAILKGRTGSEFDDATDLSTLLVLLAVLDHNNPDSLYRV